jgi:hypothetical protein
MSIGNFFELICNWKVIMDSASRGSMREISGRIGRGKERLEGGSGRCGLIMRR